MLFAKRVSDGKLVEAYFQRPADGPFRCSTCGDEVSLKTGKGRKNHFAHTYPLASHYAVAEGDGHRKCKTEIYQALLREPHVEDVQLEKPLGPVRPDIYAKIDGTPVAIEIQFSSISVKRIKERTAELGRMGIYVIWILPWPPKPLDGKFTPRPFEKWLEAAYGQVIYWTNALTTVGYRFAPQNTPSTSKEFNPRGLRPVKPITKQSNRKLEAIRVGKYNLALDLYPVDREWFEFEGVIHPPIKIFGTEPNSKPR